MGLWGFEGEMLLKPLSPAAQMQSGVGSGATYTPRPTALSFHGLSPSPSIAGHYCTLLHILSP